MKRILITTGNGMFGKALAEELVKENVKLRLMVRNRSKCNIEGPGVEIVAADMDRPESLKPVMEDVDTIFLSSPMGSKIYERETAVIHAARSAGVKHLVKILGAVKHEGDHLDKMHQKVYQSIKESGMEWTMVSPSSVMETSFLGQTGAIKKMRSLIGCSGKGRIGFVALKNVAEVTAHVCLTDGHNKSNYELTGPESIDMYEAAKRFSSGLDARIDYIDMTEEQFSSMMSKHDSSMTAERLEIELLCHLRAWREGRADLLTDTYKKLFGKEPISLENWVRARSNNFKKGMLPMVIARLVRRFP